MTCLLYPHRKVEINPTPIPPALTWAMCVPGQNDLGKNVTADCPVHQGLGPASGLYSYRGCRKWTASCEFSSASAYKALFFGRSSFLGASHLWKTQALGRVRFFGWLVLHGRCWTSDRLRRHGLSGIDVCALCAREVETLDHYSLVVSTLEKLGSACYGSSAWRICPPRGRSRSRSGGWVRGRRSPSLPVTTLIPWYGWSPGRFGRRETDASTSGRPCNR
jgi:hypothetical protein